MIRSLPVVVYMTLVLILACGESTRAADGTKIADGEWTVKVSPSVENTLRRTTRPYGDVITIKDGKLSTKVSSKFGYQPAKCEAKKESGKMLVLAELTHRKHGRNAYKLRFEGDSVKGSLEWGKMGEDGKPKKARFSIDGSKKGKTAEPARKPNKKNETRPRPKAEQP